MNLRQKASAIAAISGVAIAALIFIAVQRNSPSFAVAALAVLVLGLVVSLMLIRCPNCGGMLLYDIRTGMPKTLPRNCWRCGHPIE